MNDHMSVSLQFKLCKQSLRVEVLNQLDLCIINNNLCVEHFLAV